jgi:predicted acylesterase/phospholipase RssA
MKIGLALSGGGFRASLFHLGVVRRLAAEGRLAKVERIASVSGGSITAAHLLKNWEQYNSSPIDFDRIATIHKD